MRHFPFLVLLILSACSALRYETVEPGDLSGRLIVEWYAGDQFVFRPDGARPLTFTRSDGYTIRPGTFRTDGGSIPAPFRVFKHYSPWGYAPAFIVHDWIFAEHHCGRLPEIGFATSATIMSEVVKTMMESGRYGPPAPAVLETMDLAVRSTVARGYWDNGSCLPGDVPDDIGTLRAPAQRFVVDF